MMSDIRVERGDRPAALRSSPSSSVSAEVAQPSPNSTTRTPLLIRGDARALPLPDDSVDLIVTSPPYFGLRSYTDGGEHYDGQIGAETDPAEFIAALIECTREMVRVLKPSGSIFLNLGDKYNSAASGQNLLGKKERDPGGRSGTKRYPGVRGRASGNVPTKSLMLLPERYRIAAVDELGLIARAVIVWSKPNGLPESVKDRVKRSHEDWVHLTRQPRCFSSIDDIREQYSGQDGGRGRPYSGRTDSAKLTLRAKVGNPLGKLPGSVWEIATQPLRVPAELGVDHFAAFPMEWPRRLILGWSPPGGVVLDPFSGTGTTALVASMLGRQGIGVDASRDYCRLAEWRVNDPKQRERASRPAKRKPTPDDTQEETVSGIDFTALGTGMDIRQALDVLARPGTQEVVDAVGVVLDRVKELETRLSTARRTAWVAVKVEATTVTIGDVVVASDGVLMEVTGADPVPGTTKIRLTFAGRDGGWSMPGDYPVPVLRRPTADALDILTRQLGAQVTK